MAAIRIKKYPNRRLYDTSRSAYINLDDLAGLVRDGHTIEVVDAKSGDDLTREVLLQVVLEVLKGADYLPTGMLRRLIRASGDGPRHRLLRQQLVTGMELMSGQMDRWEAMMPSPTPPPPAASAAEPPVPEPAPAPKADPDNGDGGDPELADLRARLADLERRLSRD